MESNQKKGQAALEFLTTYGWAFLVILIMIGTLAYFGILNPSKLLPSRCTVGPEFECLDYQIDAVTNVFKLRMKNNVGEPIGINSMTFSSESSTLYNCPTLTAPAALPAAWKSGDIVDFAWSGCNSALAGVVSGEKTKVSVKINYNTVKSGSSYAKDVNLEVFSSVK